MEDGSLCCCEYLDIRNERNHILACCCNCEDLDESVESLITGKGVPHHRKKALMATLQDRIRIPWRGGAKQVSLDAFLPIVIIPVMLLLASISHWWTVFSFTTVLVFLSYFSFNLRRTIPNTKFFFVWSCVTLCIQYVIFEFIVIPFLQILVEENIALSILILGFVVCLYITKCPMTSSMEGTESELENGQADRINSSPRAHNCSICRLNIPEYDHHCIWFDCCVGCHNQCWFILTLFFAEAALLYSSNLTLTSVCHPFNFYKTILLPDDCSEVYEQFELGLSFVSAIYSLGIALFLLFLLLHQLWLVTLGMTGREWRALPFTKKCCFGLTVHRPYSRGVFYNWLRMVQCTKRHYCLVNH